MVMARSRANAARGGALAARRVNAPGALVNRTTLRALRRVRAIADDATNATSNINLDAAPRPTVLVAEKLGAAGIELLEQYAEVDCSYDLDPSALCEKIASCDAIIVRSGTKVSREVFTASRGRLRVVGRAGVGIDNVDLPSATENGCIVVNAPTANTVAAAEHGIAMLCALSRRIPQAHASLTSGAWERSKYVGVSLVDKTLAVMGFGKVGSEVARRAKGLGMHVIAHDPYAPADKAKALGVELVSFDEAVGRGDFFSLHMPLTPDTDKMFNAAVFDAMKDTACVINVARGGVIDDQAMADALDAGKIAGAALDVFAVEPPPADHPLSGRDDVLVAPHLGASTVEAQEGVAIEIAEAVLTALRGELASSAINAPMVDPEVMKDLAPYVDLAQSLAAVACQLVSGAGIQEVEVEYTAASVDELDTRLLRANIVKGLVERTCNLHVNLVNADLIAEQRSLRIAETKRAAKTVTADGGLISEIVIRLGNSKSKFPSALGPDGCITVGGKVRGGQAMLTRLGPFSMDVQLAGSMVLCRQVDQPGMIGRVGAILGENDVNVSFMTVGRTGPREEAVMAIGVDDAPPSAAVRQIEAMDAIKEAILIDLA